MSQRRIAQKSQLLNEQKVTTHQIPVDPDDPDVYMEVTVKSLTFLDIQRAAQEMLEFVDGQTVFKFEGYWRHAFTHWVVSTNPSLTTDELLNLNGFVGEQLSQVLPKPDEMAQEVEGGFREPIETE